MLSAIRSGLVARATCTNKLWIENSKLSGFDFVLYPYKVTSERPWHSVRTLCDTIRGPINHVSWTRVTPVQGCLPAGRYRWVYSWCSGFRSLFRERDGLK